MPQKASKGKSSSWTDLRVWIALGIGLVIIVPLVVILLIATGSRDSTGRELLEYYQKRRSNTTWYSPGTVTTSPNVQIGLPKGVTLEKVELYLSDYSLVRRYLLDAGVPELGFAPGRNISKTTLLYVYDAAPPKFLENGEATFNSSGDEVVSFINLKNIEQYGESINQPPAVGLARHLRLTELHVQAACLSVYTDEQDRDPTCNIVSRNLGLILVGLPTDQVEAKLDDFQLDGKTHKTTFLLNTVESFVTWVNARK